MHEIHDALQALIQRVPAQLHALAAPPHPLGDESWSHKQLLGHLIDSAANNHQRFVRAAIADGVQFPAYEQEAWVRTQAYDAEEWEQLISLWTTYNRHLLHVVDHLPEEAYQHRCQVGSDAPVTLDFLIRDYLRHIQHHLVDLLPEGN